MDWTTVREITNKTFPVNVNSPKQQTQDNRVKRLPPTSQVIDILCGDAEGPVIVTLWNDALHQVKKLVQEATQKKEPFLLRLEAFHILPLGNPQWNGTCHTRIHRLQSLRETTEPTAKTTQVSLVPVPQAETPVDFDIPPSEICITSLASLPQPLHTPFRVSVSGIVSDVSEILYTTMRDPPMPKVYFQLTDTEGISCSVWRLVTMQISTICKWV